MQQAGRRVMCVFGTRPEAVKMGPVVRAIEADAALTGIVCATGQHREMLDQVLRVFQIQPDYDLRVMKPMQDLYDITSGVVLGMRDVIERARPDLVLVHGDTTTSFAAALSAFYARVPVGHVEAGLRTWDRYSPYPEEINRQLNTRIATLHFAPTQENADNLRREGVAENVYITGNTAIDALGYTVRDGYAFDADDLADLVRSGRRIVTVTCHRRENYGQPMQAIFRGIRRLAQELPDTTFLYPVHLSAQVRATAAEAFAGVENVVLRDPLIPTDMHNLMARSALILTDSGGIQEEAPSLGVPVLVMRTETERPEAVKAGTVKVVGVTEQGVYEEAMRLLTDPAAHAAMASAQNPYGDGRASQHIVQAIHEYFARQGGTP